MQRCCMDQQPDPERLSGDFRDMPLAWARRGWQDFATTWKHAPFEMVCAILGSRQASGVGYSIDKIMGHLRNNAGVRETFCRRVNSLLPDPTPAALAQAVTHMQDDPALAGRSGDAVLVAEYRSVPAAAERLEHHMLGVAGRHGVSRVPTRCPDMEAAADCRYGAPANGGLNT